MAKPVEKKSAPKLDPKLSWQSDERPQTWVLRYSETWVDRRVIKKETPLWRYCVSRHKQRWKGTKRENGPPMDYRNKSEDGKDFGVGWWFPTIWTEEFKPGRSTAIAAPRGKMRTVFPIQLTSFSLAKLQSWGLPTGTIFNAADETVIYPNGAVEGWAAIERRLRGGVGEQSPADRDDDPPPPSYT